MQNNARVGGILSIISGAFGVLWLFWIIIMVFLFLAIPWESEVYYSYETPHGFFTFIVIFYIILGGFFTLVGVLAIVGGVFALKKKHWGWALAGSIAGTLVFFPCGIPAIIFTALGKQEFNPQQQSATTVVRGQE